MSDVNKLICSRKVFRHAMIWPVSTDCYFGGGAKSPKSILSTDFDGSPEFD